MMHSVVMKSRAWLIWLAAAGIVLGKPEETKLGFSSLPPGVQNTAKRQSEGATVRGYSKEVEHGKTYYEVELSADGKTRDVLLDSSGNVVEVEQEVEFNALPDTVKTELTKQAAGGRITKVERISRGSSVSYEALVFSNGKSREVAIRP